MAAQDTVAAAVPATRALTKLNSNQIKGFWAAWGGWTLDGMDAFIYALVLVPALTELLPRSGIEATPGNIGYYGSILHALFLLGWGLSMVVGPDRGSLRPRARADADDPLLLGVHASCAALVTNVWQLGVLRILCGIGIGGEQPMGGTFVAEEWPEDRRKMGAGYMHTGYYFGFFLAALANYFDRRELRVALDVHPRRRAGAARRLDPERRARADDMAGQGERTRAAPACSRRSRRCSRREYARRTIINSLLFTVSIVGLWAGSIYVPDGGDADRPCGGLVAADAARLASYGRWCCRSGRSSAASWRPGSPSDSAAAWRWASTSRCSASPSRSPSATSSTSRAALTLFFVLIFFLGVGGANFAIYTLWLPEQYSTDCRASAIAFVSSVGRFVGVAMVFLVGAAIQRYGSLGVPVAVTAVVFVLGVLLLPLAVETRGKALPT